MRKRIFAVAGATALLALPVVATGPSAAAGTRGDDFRISFTLKTRGDEPTALKNFKFSRLDATCAGGGVAEVRGRFPYIKVNDENRFSESIRRPSKKVRVKGRVSGDLETVRGTIRARGDFGKGAQNCDSGRVRWVAR